MEIIRKKTDYAFRLMQFLSDNHEKQPISARKLSAEENVSYQMTCKLLQELREAGLVGSSMGPKGGYFLERSPGSISLADIVNTIQGPIRLSDCLLGLSNCNRKTFCGVHRELNKLGEYIDEFLLGITLDELKEMKGPGNKINIDQTLDHRLNNIGGNE